jgi:hypothetical protein
MNNQYVINASGNARVSIHGGSSKDKGFSWSEALKSLFRWFRDLFAMP